MMRPRPHQMGDLPLAELMTVTALAERLRDPKVRIVQVTSAARFASGHVPGAVLVTPNELVSGVAPAVGKLPDRERLTTLIQRLGLNGDTCVVAYDDEGGGWAGRLLWTLDVVGHHDWAYLDGGLNAWIADGLPLSTETFTPTPNTAAITIDRHPIVDVEEILARLGDAAFVIWDCRSEAEYRGTKSGSARAGRVPGAVHLDWLDLMDPARHLRLRTDLPALLARAGIRTDADIVTHCQTHHRSGLSYLVGRLLGLSIRAYDGSWAEWGNRPDTPIESGP